MAVTAATHHDAETLEARWVLDRGGVGDRRQVFHTYTHGTVDPAANTQAVRTLYSVAHGKSAEARISVHQSYRPRQQGTGA